MLEVGSCSYDRLEQIDSLSRCYIKKEEATVYPQESERSNDRLPERRRHVVKIMGVFLGFSFINPGQITINPSLAKDFVEIEGLDKKLARQYRQFAEQEAAENKTMTSFEDTIDMEDILLEREIIAEYQSKMKSFIRKRQQRKIRF